MYNVNYFSLRWFSYFSCTKIKKEHFKICTFLLRFFFYLQQCLIEFCFESMIYVLREYLIATYNFDVNAFWVTHVFSKIILFRGKRVYIHYLIWLKIFWVGSKLLYSCRKEYKSIHKKNHIPSQRKATRKLRKRFFSWRVLNLPLLVVVRKSSQTYV